MLANVADFPRILPEVHFDAEDMGIILGLADLGAQLPQGLDADTVRKTIVREATPGISRLLVRDLSKDARARRLVLLSYLTAPDPMAEYREVATYDYFTVLSRSFPESAATEWYEEEGPEGGPSGFLGNKKKRRKRWRRIGKIAVIAAVVVGAVVVGVATGGAAIPALLAVGTTAMSMSQAKKKAAAEKKSVKQAEAELAAANAPVTPPPPGENAPTGAAAFNATADSLAGNPGAQGAVQAQGEIVQGVIPQAMASYAAGQVQGKTKEQLAAELGVKPEEISDARLAEANAVAAGAEPTAAGTPGWVLPAAAGGGILLAVASGVI